METAEARTRWPSNRCYVHESSSESSKFCCCSSSSSPYLSRPAKSNHHSPENASKEPHNTISDYISPYPNPDSPTTRQWWLKKEPDLARRKEFMSATVHQVSTEDEFEILSNEFINKELQSDVDSSPERLGKLSSTRVGIAHETKTQGLKAVPHRDHRNIGSGKDVRDFWYLDDHLADMDSLNSLVSEESKKVASDFESHWVGADDKTEPWWRISGKDDLASFVAQKSMEIENNDLPRPRIYRKQPSSCSKSLSGDNTLGSSLDRVANMGLSGLGNISGSPNSVYSAHDSEGSFSWKSGHSKTSADKTDAQTEKNNDDDDDDEGTKAQLLRALCLSQKRAREAEKAAKQAAIEKEQIITLLFRQASQLFAYKQWIRLLQLENICRQRPIYDLVALPWTPRQAKKARGRHRGGDSKPRHEISKCLVALALGFGLAGAGLLLGWTMGWLFPNV